MCDLMSGTYTYDALVSKYSNFHAPAVRLYVNDKDAVQELALSIPSVTISLSLAEASTAVIHLNNVYDPVKRSLDSRIRDKFKLGTVVEVGIGYSSEIHKVLKGYVASLRVGFGSNTSLVITVADVRKLMMISGDKIVQHDVKKYSDAVQKVLGEYSKLCTAEIEATDDQLDKPLSQWSNDYDFITRELVNAGCYGMEFLVVGDKAYFRKHRGNEEAICSLELGKGLKEFNAGRTYADLQVNVFGYCQNADVVYASAKIKSEDTVSLMPSTPVHTIVSTMLNTQDKVDMCAKSYSDKVQTEEQNGSGVCVGLPVLVPGRYVKVAMLDKMVNKTYYIQRVTHRIDGGGFVTEFETGG